MNKVKFPKGLHLVLKLLYWRESVPVKAVFEFTGEYFAIIAHAPKPSMAKPFYFAMHIKTGLKFGAGCETIAKCIEKEISFLKQLPEASLQKAIAGKEQVNTLAFIGK